MASSESMSDAALLQCDATTNNDDDDVVCKKEALAHIRAKTAAVFSTLDERVEEEEERDTNNTNTGYRSWIRGPISLFQQRCVEEDNVDTLWYPTRRCRYFDKHGFLRIPSFVDANVCFEMKAQMTEWTERRWNPDADDISVFRTDDEQVRGGRQNYFLESADRIHFFTEKDATDEHGTLKPQFLQNKVAALNKAGHGLHLISGPFRTYTTSSTVSEFVRELGWIEPVVPQSMYIFKQPRIGGEVTSHQDSTFLYTTPKQSCLGLWLALDDATIENGCLWVRPGSHNETVRRRFVRNPAYFGTDSIDDRSNVPKGDDLRTPPMMIFETIHSNTTIPWEGRLPRGSQSAAPIIDCDGLFGAGFIPVECKAGDLIAFPGQLDHLSLPNYSKFQRHTFQLHLVEGENTGDVTWATSNWLQYPTDTPFLSI